MSAPASARMMRQLTRTISKPSLARGTMGRGLASKLQTTQPRVAAVASTSSSQSRCFTVSRPTLKGIQPDTEEPAPAESEPIHDIQEATPISDAEYHERAEKLLEEIVIKMEEMQESREDIDAEYSAGVLNITFPPSGTYVLNKQPPNKQIWLSSPITGPKRFDWVIKGEDISSKEGGASGDWIYLRDGTSLISLLRKELGITVGNDEGSVE